VIIRAGSLIRDDSIRSRTRIESFSDRNLSGPPIHRHANRESARSVFGCRDAYLIEALLVDAGAPRALLPQIRARAAAEGCDSRLIESSTSVPGIARSAFSSTVHFECDAQCRTGRDR